MRFYRIAIDGGPTWDSTGDPAALDVEIDVNSASYALPQGQSSVVIWGIDLQTIAQAKQFTGKTVTVTVGMAKGLPLADPSQQGIIAYGTIQPGFGNWIETEMTLNLVLSAPQMGTSPNARADTPHNPAPIVHSWQANTPLSQAIKQTLTTAYPAFTPQISISQKLILPYVDTGWYRTIESYAGYIRQISQSIMNDPKYQGVHIFPNNNTLTVTDNTQAASGNKQVQFKDLVGQPTWLGLNVVSVKTIMRGDIKTGDTITLPQTLATTAAQSSPQFRQNSAFQGSFFVRQARHVGRFRQPDGNAWCSIFEVIPSGSQ